MHKDPNQILDMNLHQQNIQADFRELTYSVLPALLSDNQRVAGCVLQPIFLSKMITCDHFRLLEGEI